VVPPSLLIYGHPIKSTGLCRFLTKQQEKGRDIELTKSQVKVEKRK